MFTRLSTPTVSYPDDHTIAISADVASMGLAIDLVDIGFAAGFCGGSDYYCDHFPDGWGDPYNYGMVTTLWFPLEW